MSAMSNRRQWLLGLATALVGAGAARAAEAVPLGAPALLSWGRQTGPHSCATTYLELPGRVELTPGPGDGEVTVARCDREGKLLDRQIVLATRFTYLPSAAPVQAPVAEYTGCPTVTYWYDSELGMLTRPAPGSTTSQESAGHGDIST